MNLRVQMATKNECYIQNKKMTVKGVMVHSTGANNPNLKRYVQPDDGLLGNNPNGNSFNEFRPDGRQVCVHAFIGKLANGNIATYQTLPWNVEGWHGGSGTKGRCNDNYIGFEICEDALTDVNYFNTVYKEAVEFTAYLCNLYKLNPLADGIVICHAEGYQRGIATNHGDVNHWFPKFGKTMNDFRNDVNKEMNKDKGELSVTQYEELKKEIETLKEANNNLSQQIKNYTDSSRIKYAWLDGNFPAWAKKDIQTLIDKKLLNGIEFEENGKKVIKYQLSDDMIRILIITGRMTGILPK